MKQLLLTLILALNASAQPRATWLHDAPRHWTYRSEQEDLGYVTQDWWGYWAFDTRFGEPQLAGFAPTLTGAEQQLERRLK